jgi:enoyl-CoA hydratase/carnithine racemase
MDSVMSDQLIQEAPSDYIRVLRLNRPDRYNALSRELVTSLRAAVKSLAGTKVKVLVLAASRPGFCAGADLKERKVMTTEEKYAHNRAISALADEIAAAPIPTIAAINGLALGGGCELALACDMRFAACDASIGLTEARIGAMPGAGGSQRLPRLIGSARALEMMFSGEPITAAKALEWGLVNGLVDSKELDQYTLSFAQLLESRSRLAAGLLKKVVYQGLDSSLAEGLELERLAIVEVLASDDYTEGLTAFAERRQPKFD